MLRHIKHPKSYISTLIDTELEREVGLMMAKENFRFDDIYFFRGGVFQKKQKTYSQCFFHVVETFVNVWENSKTSWKRSSFCSCSHSISRSPITPLAFLCSNQNMSSRFLSRGSRRGRSPRERLI